LWTLREGKGCRRWSNRFKSWCAIRRRCTKTEKVDDAREPPTKGEKINQNNWRRKEKFALGEKEKKKRILKKKGGCSKGGTEGDLCESTRSGGRHPKGLIKGARRGGA